MDALQVAQAPLSLPLRLHLMKHDGIWPRPRKAFVPMSFGSGAYTLKTADSYEEYLQVMQLRHVVFQKEFAKKRFCLRSDRDKYDTHADFLIVRDNKSNSVVGCYRMICSLFSEEFYSSSEFDISRLLSKDGVKLELSRACILREHRNGRVINLLWRGIALYMKKVNPRFFFGCGSVQTIDPQQIRKVEQKFAENSVYSTEYHFLAKRGYRMNESQMNKPSAKLSEETVEIPNLIESYLKVGARVCSEPAIDRKFRCTDFLIVLDTGEINAAYKDRYASNHDTN